MFSGIESSGILSDDDYTRSRADDNLDLQLSSCHMDDVAGMEEHLEVERFFRRSEYEAEIINRCEGETYCLAEVNQSLYLEPGMKEEVVDEGHFDGAIVFMQYTCSATRQQMRVKWAMGLILVSCCVLIRQIFYAYLNNMYNSCKYETLYTDLATCTPDDYAVRI